MLKAWFTHVDLRIVRQLSQNPIQGSFHLLRLSFEETTTSSNKQGVTSENRPLDIAICTILRSVLILCIEADAVLCMAGCAQCSQFDAIE